MFWLVFGFEQLHAIFIDTILQGTHDLQYISIHNTKTLISVIQQHYNKISFELYLTYCKTLCKQLNVIQITLVGAKFHKK